MQMCQYLEKIYMYERKTSVHENSYYMYLAK